MSSQTSFLCMLVIFPVRVFNALCKSLFHSWFKFRWTPSSRTWLIGLDRKIRERITHKNQGEWIKVTFGGQTHSIWTVVVQGDKRGNTPIVIIHGMGGGGNMFLNNIDALAEERDVILIDLPGFGLSSRPELRVKLEDSWWVDTTEDDVENFYTEVLELWLTKMNLDKIILLGHSFGGYICSVYCLSYSKRVQHLILADPWGYPVRPATADVRPFMRSKSLLLISKLYSKMNVFTPIRVLGPLALPLFRAFKLGIKEKFIVKINGYSVRMSSITLVQELMREDHYALWPDSTMQDYSYMWMLQSQSGEIAFSRVSKPIGWAKKPLVNRVANWDEHLDVTFIYGARSWVDSQPGYETKNQRHNNYVDVHIISGAGHHVYADRPLAFNNMVSMIGKAVDAGQKPNISHKYEQRHIAMLSLRRAASFASQAEMTSDEAGVRQRRAYSSHEMVQDEDGTTFDVAADSPRPRVTFGLYE